MNENAELDYWAWKRNVREEFKSKSTEEIQAELKARALPFAVAFDHLAHDFAVGSGMRNANAFGASAIYYIGEKHLDRRSCCGIQNYSSITHLKSAADLIALAPNDGWTLVALEINTDRAVPLDDFVWCKKPMMVFGNEASGIVQDLLDACTFVVSIPQVGSVPSLNVGVASGIAMYDFASKFRKQSQ
jgi:tRNA G18 (ribose-2'-O)-methylase SpoU